MAGRLLADYLVNPALFRAYLGALDSLGRHVESGVLNPSSLELMRSILWMNWGGNLADQPLAPLLTLYVGFVAAVGWFSWGAWWALRRQPAAPRREVLGVCLACLAFALTVPRLKDYSCILLLLPVWVAFRTALAGRRGAWLGVIAAACLGSASQFPWLNNVFTLLGGYQPLAVAFAAWAVLVWHIHRQTLPVAAPAGTTRKWPRAQPGVVGEGSREPRQGWAEKTPDI